jgi:hypothetical protein
MKRETDTPRRRHRWPIGATWNHRMLARLPGVVYVRRDPAGPEKGGDAVSIWWLIAVEIAEGPDFDLPDHGAAPPPKMRLRRPDPDRAPMITERGGWRDHFNESWVAWLLISACVACSCVIARTIAHYYFPGSLP